MTTREDLESYIVRLGAEYEEVAEDMWVVRGPDGGAPVVVHYSPPVVVLRLKVMDLPSSDDAQFAALYRRLLELNATDIVHGSYGIDDGELVLSDALELETLDFHELRSSYESLSLAASTHMPDLAALVPVTHEG
ncbi:MAG TPA: YbjN domain-containing protein [Longimicrobiales bacterium]|nr:YbjN domain-containing protein [Longimicrobiales bacterium]